MIFETSKCPKCNEPPDTILETMLVSAILTEPDEYGEQDYAGESKMHWDTQEPDDFNGQVQLTCSKGHEWYSNMLDTE